jgi:hypothetical protein
MTSVAESGWHLVDRRRHEHPQSITRLHQSHAARFDLRWANGRATVDLEYA